MPSTHSHPTLTTFASPGLHFPSRWIVRLKLLVHAQVTRKSSRKSFAVLAAQRWALRGLIMIWVGLLFSGWTIGHAYAETAETTKNASLLALHAFATNEVALANFTAANQFDLVHFQPSLAAQQKKLESEIETASPQDLSAERSQPLTPMTWGDAFDKHAPLAFFSIGSLAVGGIIVGIRSENRSKWNAHSGSPDRDIAWALGMAGVTSMIAGGAFWYYSRMDMTQSRESLDRGFTVLPTWQRGLGLATLWRMPIQGILP